ncbi:DUF6048 family protein [Mangrovibacterium lignilyticum]|uniref:DUF6048 family protein n=1 Tax=Mangrovibacterium lignilyticum TaxID=2668052 RepID=UPI0013CF5EC1|nr:DUF6048 family protein [Mangrovibacterium lignilyticum]
MKIFNYTLTIALLILTLTSWAQEQEKKKMPKRTDNFIHMPGIRLGVDFTRPFQNLWTKGDRYGSEFSGDIEVKPNLYAVTELGWEKLKMAHDYVDYEASGSYMRLGIDYNMLATESADERDIFYVGLRYAFAVASQTVNEYYFDGYWGDTTGSFPKQNFSTHWMEVVLGLKGEIFNNFYMGWSIRTKFILAQKDFDIPPVYFTPGYGKSESGVALDFTYSLYYTLPFKFRK